MSTEERPTIHPEPSPNREWTGGVLCRWPTLLRDGSPWVQLMEVFDGGQFKELSAMNYVEAYRQYPDFIEVLQKKRVLA